MCHPDTLYFREQASLFPWATISISVSKDLYFREQGSPFPWARISISVSKGLYFREQGSLFPWARISISVSKDVRIRRYFSKPKGIRKQKILGEHCSSQYIQYECYYNRQNKLLYYARILCVFLRKQPSTVTEQLPCQEMSEHISSPDINGKKKKNYRPKWPLLLNEVHNVCRIMTHIAECSNHLGESTERLSLRNFS